MKHAMTKLLLAAALFVNAQGFASCEEFPSRLSNWSLERPPAAASISLRV